MDFETERVEFKPTGTDEIYKEVIAFANTDGGTIYIGIDDNENVIGVDQIDETYTRLTNGIRDAIQPDVTIFIKYAVLENRIDHPNRRRGGGFQTILSQEEGPETIRRFRPPGNLLRPGIAGSDPTVNKGYGRRQF